MVRTVGTTRMAMITAVVGLALVASACSSSSVTSSITTTSAKATTTTVPVTTTTATSIGGFIATSTCPNLPVMSDGYSSIQEGGTQVFYTVSGTASMVLATCQSQLAEAGWKVQGSTPGATAITATMGAAYAQIEISADGSSAAVSVCTWPSQPTNTTCPLGG